MNWKAQPVERLVGSDPERGKFLVDKIGAKLKVVIVGVGTRPGKMETESEQQP